MMIKDAIHGNIFAGELEEKIIDTAQFQRLRRIKQLAMAYLVYPGATHTRFEHSLGTMHLASGICDSLGIGGIEKEKVRIHALLHDIGHSAFSHESEKALSGFFGNHEEVGAGKMREGELGDLLMERFSKKEIGMLGRGVEKTAIAGDVGADRMDYLLRDAYHIGVSYGAVDVDRIIHTLELEGKRLVVERGGLEATETLLIGRFMMFSTVYLHKTVRIASAMLRRAIGRAVDEGVEPKALLEGTDESVLRMLEEGKESGAYASALAQRKLYKRAYSVEGSIANYENAEKELSGECGCDVIVDAPPASSRPPDIMVREEGKTVGIMEASDLVRSLFMAEEKRKKTLVLCPAGHREKVAAAAKRYFLE